MADAEELRQLTLAAKAKLALHATRYEDLDDNVLAGKVIQALSLSLVLGGSLLDKSLISSVSSASLGR